jgi:LuxR family transcriptional regulator of csgAB operon
MRVGGGKGFFYETDPLDRFLKGVRAVLEGELWLSREIMTKCILEGTDEPRSSRSGSELLTPRQIQILAQVAIGATNDEIADVLYLSPHTVRTHLYNIFKKINVPNRLQAALWAAKNL